MKKNRVFIFWGTLVILLIWLIYEDLWYIERTEPSPYQSNVSNNEALIRESMNIFSDDDYMGNILDTVLINDEIISKIFK